MPEHTGFLTYLLALSKPLRENAHNVGQSFVGHQQVEYRGLEPIFTSLLVIALVIFLAAGVRSECTIPFPAVIQLISPGVMNWSDPNESRW